MNSVTRGIRNAFRNVIRTVSIVIILGLSTGLALSMLVAHQAVGQRINTVKSSTGNTITVSPAGVRGFAGGGTPLTESQLSSVNSIDHVVSVEESLNDRLTSSDTNLQSPISAGSLGQRFASNGGGFGGGSGGGLSTQVTTNFTPPIVVIGSTNPENLNLTIGGGTFKLTSGSIFSDNSTADVAVVGSSLASKNNLSVGSTFTAYNTSIKVVGIYSAGNTFSDSQLIMPISTVQTLSGQPNDVTSAIVTVDSIANVNQVSTQIQKQLGSAADVTTAQQQTQAVLSPLQNIQTISLYSVIGAATAGAVIILLAMIMIVRERRREIGVIKAIGASNIKVVKQFMSEAITLTLLGSVIGIIIGYIAASPITRLLATNNTSSTGGGGGFGGGARLVSGGRGAAGFFRNNLTNLHAEVSWTIIIYGIVAAIVIAVVGSAIVSFFIAKIRPAEVMRVE